MSKYTLGPDVDPEHDDVQDSRGNRIDSGYIEQAVEDVHHQLPGRPSLAPGSGTSPAVSVRLTSEEKARAKQLAREEGVSLSEFVREALNERLDHAG